MKKNSKDAVEKELRFTFKFSEKSKLIDFVVREDELDLLIKNLMRSKEKFNLGISKKENDKLIRC